MTSTSHSPTPAETAGAAARAATQAASRAATQAAASATQAASAAASTAAAQARIAAAQARAAAASANAAFLAVKPRLRGWIHAATAPLALSACITLTALAPTAPLAWACAVYLTCSLLLFANSGVYHIGNGHWPQRVSRTLQRLDHANIYLLIAGTYTPLSVALLPTSTARLVLGIVWAGAVGGIISCLAWAKAPRWLSTGLYVLLGWVAIWFLPTFWRAGGAATVLLIIAGGVIYTAGAVVYARKHPDPLPRWFGFHEVFHVCTVAAWICQCVACYLAILG